MYDIDQDAINDTADMPLRKANGDPVIGPDGKQASITLYGPGTAEYSRARHKAQQAATARTMAAFGNAGAGQAQQTAEQARQERAEFLASITVSFNGFGRAGLSGPPLFRAVYGDLKLGHIAEAADKWVAERANFLPQSPAA